MKEKIIDTARHAIRKCNNRRSLHASILTTEKGFILCSGINSEIGQLHSEYACLRKFNRMALVGKLNECYLWNVRFLRNGKLAMSKPCLSCQAYLRRFPPRKVFYSNEEGDFVLWTN